MAKKKREGEKKPSLADRAKAYLKRMRRLGKAEMAGYGRSGLVDLQNALQQAFPDSQQPASDPAHLGQITPQESVEQKGEFEKHLKQQAQQAQARTKERGRGMEM